MRVTSALLALALILGACTPAVAQTIELRTWATPAAAPADGSTLCTSTSFTVRSRLGGPFAGRAESASYALWGCGAYTPVEAAFYASAEGDECVTLRWVIASLDDIIGLNVYRASAAEGPFERINPLVMEAVETGFYEDTSVWPGSQFWYELWAVMSDGSEEKASPEPVTATTTGELVTRLFAASPNPFRGETVIQLDVAPTIGEVRLVVYDVSGRAVKILADKPMRPGRYTARWNGTNDAGQQVASGVYLCLLDAGGKRERRSIVLLR